MWGLPCTMPFGSKRVKRKASHELFQRHAMLQADADMATAKQFIRLRKAAPSLCMVHEDFTERAIGVLTGA